MVKIKAEGVQRGLALDDFNIEKNGRMDETSNEVVESECTVYLLGRKPHPMYPMRSRKTVTFPQ